MKIYSNLVAAVSQIIRYTTPWGINRAQQWDTFEEFFARQSETNRPLVEAYTKVLLKGAAASTTNLLYGAFNLVNNEMKAFDVNDYNHPHPWQVSGEYLYSTFLSKEDYLEHFKSVVDQVALDSSYLIFKLRSRSSTWLIEAFPNPEYRNRGYGALASRYSDKFDAVASITHESYGGNLPLYSITEDGVHERVNVPEGTTIARGYLGTNDIYLLSYHDAMSTLEGRRDQARRALASRMPGYAAQEAARQQELRDVEARREAALQRFVKNRHSGVKRETDEVIGTLPFVEHGTPASRRWGIEVETGAGRLLTGTPSGWDSKGDGSLESAYMDAWLDPQDCPQYADEHTTPTITVYDDRDNEIEIPNPDFEDPRYCDYCGDNASSYNSDDCVELVSPILTSMHSNGLKAITDDLESGPVTDSAGIHVHVEVKDLTVKQLMQLTLAYDRIEPIIEASYRRTERGYCKLRDSYELLDVVRHNRTVTSPRDIRAGDRYVTLNLLALRAHGTVEFRAMGPVYNYDYLVRWAMFAREMVNTIANGATAKDWNKVSDWAGVLKMFSKYGNEYKIAAGEIAAELDNTLVAV